MFPFPAPATKKQNKKYRKAKAEHTEKPDKYRRSKNWKVIFNIKMQKESRRINQFDPVFEPTGLELVSDEKIANLDEMVKKLELFEDLNPGPEYKVNPEPEVDPEPEVNPEPEVDPEPSNATYAPGWSNKDRIRELSRELWLRCDPSESLRRELLKVCE